MTWLCKMKDGTFFLDENNKRLEIPDEQMRKFVDMMVENGFRIYKDFYLIEKGGIYDTL